MAHNFSKLSLLEAYNIQHKFDMICLLDERLYKKGYNLIKGNNPSDRKKGGVGICYKEFIAVCSVQVKNLNKCVIFGLSIKNKMDMWFPL